VQASEDVPSELRKDYTFNSSIDRCVGENLGVLAQVNEVTQGENEGFIAMEGVYERLVRGEIDLDLARVIRSGNLGLGGVANDNSDVELARSDEGVKYRLAERA
jgi:hypothetical protein